MNLEKLREVFNVKGELSKTAVPAVPAVPSPINPATAVPGEGLPLGPNQKRDWSQRSQATPPATVESTATPDPGTSGTKGKTNLVPPSTHQKPSNGAGSQALGPVGPLGPVKMVKGNENLDGAAAKFNRWRVTRRGGELIICISAWMTPEQARRYFLADWPRPYGDAVEVQPAAAMAEKPR